jgi:hypothetical protein
MTTHDAVRAITNSWTTAVECKVQVQAFRYARAAFKLLSQQIMALPDRVLVTKP